jgi:hypothetical protein
MVPYLRTPLSLTLKADGNVVEDRFVDVFGIWCKKLDCELSAILLSSSSTHQSSSPIAQLSSQHIGCAVNSEFLADLGVARTTAQRVIHDASRFLRLEIRILNT